MFELLDQIRRSWDDSKFVLIFDSVKRQAEIEMMLPAQLVESYHLTDLRLFAGGPIRVVIDSEFAHQLSLPSLNVLYEGMRTRYPIFSKLVSGNKDQNSGISIDHRCCAQDKSDQAKAKTISKIGEISENWMNQKNIYDLREEFSKNFVIPGQVHIKHAKKGLLRIRQGHSELGIALTEITNHAPAVVMSTLMDRTSGTPITLDQGYHLANEMQIPIIEGRDLLNLWRSIKKIDKKKIKVQQL